MNFQTENILFLIRIKFVFDKIFILGPRCMIKDCTERFVQKICYRLKHNTPGFVILS